MGELVRYRFSVSDYHRMGDLGLFDEGTRLELLDGEVVEMSPIGSRHAACVDWLTALFTAAPGHRTIVRVQNPVVLDDRSEPQPDVSLLRSRPDFYSSGHPQPADILLLVEVADTTIGSDRAIKVPLYAAAAVDEVWLVDLPAGAVRLFRQPVGDGYQTQSSHTAGDVLIPLALPDVRLDIGRMFRTLGSTGLT